MTEQRRRWIDDDSDEYESEDEMETQPTSVSPARRGSITPSLPSVRDPVELAVDCLSKHIRLVSAPYQFLLLGIPYKLKTAKKVSAALFESETDAAMCEIQVLYHKQQHTGKCLVTVRTEEAALAFVRVHGRKIGNRTVAVDIAPMTQRRPTAKPTQIAKKPSNEPKQLTATAQSSNIALPTQTCSAPPTVEQ